MRLCLSFSDEASLTSQFTDFLVPDGSGAAVQAISTHDGIISDCVFEDNLADTGSGIYAVNLRSLDITNSSFSKAHRETETGHQSSEHPDDTGLLVEFSSVTFETCQSAPCSPGHECLWDDSTKSKLCSMCAIGSFGDGITCIDCPAGSQPSQNQTAVIRHTFSCPFMTVLRCFKRSY